MEKDLKKMSQHKKIYLLCKYVYHHVPFLTVWEEAETSTDWLSKFACGNTTGCVYVRWNRKNKKKWKKIWWDHMNVDKSKKNKIK